MAVIVEWDGKSKTVSNMSAAKAFIGTITERPITIYNRETGEFKKIEDSRYMKRKIKDTKETFIRVNGKRPEDVSQTEANKIAIAWTKDNDKKLVSAKVGTSWTVTGVYITYTDAKIKDFDPKLIALIKQMKSDNIPNHKIAMNLEKRFDASEVRKALSSFKDSKYKITISNKDGKIIKTKITDSAKEALKIKHRITDSKYGLKIKVTRIKDAILIKSFVYKGRNVDIVKDEDAFAWWVYANGQRLYMDDGFSTPNEAISGAKHSIDKRISQGYKDGCHKTKDADIRHLTRKDFINKYNAGIFKGKLKPEDMQRGKWTGTYKSGEGVTVEFKDSKKLIKIIYTKAKADAFDMLSDGEEARMIAGYLNQKYGMSVNQAIELIKQVKPYVKVKPESIKDDDSYGGKYYLKLVTSNGSNKIYTMDTEESAINWAKEMGVKGKKVTVSKGLHGTIIYKTRDSKIKDWSKDLVLALVKKGYSAKDIAMKLIDPNLDNGDTYLKEKLAISAYAQELINSRLKKK